MRGVTMAVAFLLALVGAGSAAAQVPPFLGGDKTEPVAGAPPVPAELKATQVEGFVAGLTDAQTRQVLIERLRHTAAASEPAEAGGGRDFAGLLRAARDAAAKLAERSDEAMAALPGVPDALAKAFELMTDLEGTAALPTAALALSSMLLSGLLLEWLLRRRLRGVAGLEAGSAADNRSARRTAVMRCLVDLVGVVVFGIGAFVLSFAWFERFHPMREALIAGVILIVVVRVTLAVASLLLGGASGEGRMTALSLPPRQVTMIAGLAAFGAVALGLLKLYGFPAELLVLFQIGWGALTLAPIVVLVARAAQRPVVVEAMPTADEGALDDFASRLGTAIGGVWRRLALPTLLMLWLVWAVDLLVGYGEGARNALICALCIIGMPAVDQVVASVLGGAAMAGGRGEWRGVARVLRVSGHVALAGLALALLIDVLSFGVLAAVVGPGPTIAIATAVSDSFVAVVLAALAWELVQMQVRRWLGEDSGDRGASVAAIEDGEGGIAKIGTRGQTLLPLFRVFALIGIFSVAGLTVLSSLGVNIAPLLAGAGVIGIAIGFGAQSLVRDVVSGIFFLVDDAFRVGEYIEFGRTRGEIERLSIRSLTLRHHRGPVHTVPFGELRAVTNHSRDWTIMKLEMGLKYDTDPNQVKKLVKKLGAELMEDPVHGRNFLEPLKSQGILRFGDSAVIMRVKFKCKPREQFILRRVINERLKAIFAANGIAFAFPTVTVLSDSESDDLTTAGAAAANAATPKPAAAPAAG